MRCWLWTWWLWHIARLCVTSSSPLPIWPSTERGATVLEALVLEALCFPISSLWAVIGSSSSLACHRRSLPIITSKARLTLNSNNPAKVILLLQEEANTRPHSHPENYREHQDSVVASNWRLSKFDPLSHCAVPSSLLWCCCFGSPPLQYSTLAFQSVSRALWRLGRQILSSSFLICQECKQTEELMSWLSRLSSLWYDAPVICDLEAWSPYWEIMWRLQWNIWTQRPASFYQTSKEQYACACIHVKCLSIGFVDRLAIFMENGSEFLQL